MNKPARLFLLPFALGLALVLTSLPAQAAAIARFSLVGDLNYNVTSTSFTSSSVNVSGTGALGYGGGALAEIGIGDAIGLETGAIFFLRKINYSVPAGSANIVFPAGTQNQIHIPVLLRFGVATLISLGAGGFVEIPTDDSTRAKNVGLEGSLRVSIPLSPTGTQFFGDLRYAHGFTDQGGIGGFKTNDIHLLLGVEIGGI